MMKETRAQGRPPRGDTEVGRTRLLDRTRDALKSRPKMDMQRREIALFAGVTPALISYYYPDKWDLFAAAARPVVADYIEEVRTILNARTSSRSKMTKLIHLFVGFNFYQGYLLDFYMENSERMARKDDIAALHEIYKEMLNFFESLLRDGLVRGGDPAFIQSSLWGLCKYIAQQPHLTNRTALTHDEHTLHDMAESVCDLFLNGAATPQFRHGLEFGLDRGALDGHSLAVA